MQRWIDRVGLAVLVALAACAEERSDAAAGSAGREWGRGELGGGGPAPASPAIPEDAPRVAFLGDSVTAGLHLPADEAFPAVLQRELFDAGVPFRLLNAGVSGDTSAGGLSRVGWLLERSDPDVLVLELGVNDGFRGVDLALIEDNLSAIVERARSADVAVVLLGMRLPPNYGDAYAEGFAGLYDRVGALEGVAYVPFFMEGVAGVADLNLPDGIHPTGEGHRRLARNVADALAAVLADLGDEAAPAE